MHFFIVFSGCCFFRKIEIVQFASRTRQLFIRLLALVKWANSASKVDKCGVSQHALKMYMYKYEGQAKITESWLMSFYWVGSFG